MFDTMEKNSVKKWGRDLCGYLIEKINVEWLCEMEETFIVNLWKWIVISDEETSSNYKSIITGHSRTYPDNF